MAYTAHWLLQQFLSGTVEWWSLLNDTLAKLEAGRTLTLVAADTMAKYKAFCVDGSGLAKVAIDCKKIFGIWQSTTTAIAASGQGQIDGYMTYASWAWTPNQPIYANTSGVLTQTRPVQDARVVAMALTATTIVLIPFGNADIFDNAMTFGTVTTSNATQTTVVSKTLDAGKAYLIEARVTAMQGNANRASYIRRALVYRNSTGGAVLQGAIDATYSVESDASWDCTLDVSANTVRVRATGRAGATIDWAARVEATEVTQSTTKTTTSTTTTSTTTTTTTTTTTAA